MTTKKIFILLGHPDKETRTGSFADAYERGARAGGHEVRRMNIGDMVFDPILHKGYKVVQPYEPDLVTAQENILWCDDFIIFYPSWWSTMPALLKGFFDRAWMPRFAFSFKKEGFMAGMFWRRLLKGRRAHVYISSDSHPFFSHILFGDHSREIKRCILSFAGFSSHVTKVGPLKFANEARLDKWRTKMEKWGRSGY
ncbi:MAG: NAD(P)H-dependent oxidoreductase [bacterium]